MAFYFDVARDSGGRVLSGATVNVYQTGTSTAASIFSDSALSTAKANPFTAGTDGLFSFYIADGNYRILVSKTGYSSFDIDPVPIEGPRTGSGENRTLSSTSHATKGKILLGTSAYDEANNRLGLGTASPNASSVLDLTSTTGSLLLPRMTTTQRDALTAANGMVVYNSTVNEVQAREGGAWVGASTKTYNVKSYGATGDGSTDDTTAISNALTDAMAANASLYFPKGTYKVAGSGSAIFTVTQPIRIDRKSVV